MSLMEFVCVGIGGCLGALARYQIQNLNFMDTEKFYYTVLINLAGCLLIGVLWGCFSLWNAPVWLNRFCIAGFLGGFTTYSSFALEGVVLLDAGRYGAMLSYLSLSVFGGLALCWFGLWATRSVAALIAAQ